MGAKNLPFDKSSVPSLFTKAPPGAILKAQLIQLGKLSNIFIPQPCLAGSHRLDCPRFLHSPLSPPKKHTIPGVSAFSRRGSHISSFFCRTAQFPRAARQRCNRNAARSAALFPRLAKGSGARPPLDKQSAAYCILRYRKLTICALVQVSSGPNSPSATPLVMPFSAAQATALA